MNKIKLLYDVVKTMKAKAVLNGVLKAQVEKDQVKIFSIQNEFEKNVQPGRPNQKLMRKLIMRGDQSTMNIVPDLAWKESSMNWESLSLCH